MVHQIALARTDVRIGERLVDRQRVGLNPFTILVPQTFLGNLTDVDFWVEVGCESLVVIAGIAVYYVENLNLVEVMLGSVCSKNARNTRVEAAAKDSAKTSFFKLVLVSPLP